MESIKNERGSVLVFVTLILVLLLIMVGMGLDTGQLTYVRSQGQAAVDAAALSAVTGLPLGDAKVTGRVDDYNSTNNYVESATNKIGGSNITYVNYDPGTGAITNLPSIAGANGVRVGLEQKNPYTGETPETGITTPVFLTPLMNFFGQPTPAAADIDVSAVAILTARPSIPIAIYQSLCKTSGPVSLLNSPSPTDNSCWTTYWDPSVNTTTVKALFKATKDCSGLPEGSINSGPILLANGVNDTVYSTAEDLFQTSPPGSCWMVPVVKDASSCNRTDDILDWAKICPTEVQKRGSPKYIKATVKCGQSLIRTTDSSCYVPKLVRDTKSGM